MLIPIDTDHLAAELKRVKPKHTGLGAWAACVLAVLGAAEQLAALSPADREQFLKATGYTPC